MTKAPCPEIAWWFAVEPKLPNGDNRPVVIGKTHAVKGKLILCQKGLHWSAEPFDALQYATGALLYKVRPGGGYLLDSDKGCSRRRTYLDMRDATEMLRAFARAEALRVIHLWDAPEIVRRYLEAGDETIRAQARAAIATRGAASAAWAAYAAAWAARAAMAANAAWAASWSTDAARAAAWAAARATDAGARQRFNEAVTKLFAEPVA